MKVQTYDQPTVQNRALPDTRQSLSTQGAFGQQVGQAVVQAGVMGGRIVDDMREKEDLATVKEATSQLRAQINQITFLDEGAYYNKQGKAAFEGYDPTRQELDKRRMEIAKTLKTKRQQQLFGDISTQYLDRELDSMSRHAAKGRTTWLNESDASTIAIAQADGSLRPDDNEEYSRQIKASVRNLAERNGWTPERTEIEVEKNLTAMHVTAFDNLLVRNPKGAKDYLDKHAGEISPAELPKMQATVQSQIDAQWSMQAGDEIRAGGGTLTQRAAKARELAGDDVDKRAALMQQVKADYAMEQQAKSDAQLDTYAQFTQQLLDGKSGSQIRLENPQSWEILSAGQRAALLKPPTEGRQETDIMAYMTIKGLDDPQERQQYFLENIDKFTTSDSKKIIDDLYSTEPVRTPSVTSKAAFDNTVVTLLGAKPASKDKSSLKEWTAQYAALNGLYETMLDEAYPNQKDITEQQRRDVLDRFYTTVKRDRKWLGLLPRSPQSIGITDVPLDEKDAIIKLLQNQGYAINPESILQVYESDDWKQEWGN